MQLVFPRWSWYSPRGQLAQALDPTKGEYVPTKQVVHRARRVQRFLSQPFHVAEVFTGAPGKYVPLRDTIASFKAIIAGEYDDLPEQAFYMAGSIDEVVAKAEKMKSKSA